MKTKNKIIKLFAFAIVFALLTSALTIDVAADNKQKGSIKIKYLEDKVSDVHFNLYKVATFDGAKFVGTGEFATYNESISFNPQNQDAWNTLAYTLKAYILRDDVNSTKDAYTNRNYQLTFSDLDKGLYLVVGEKVKSGKITYKSAPFFVILPYQDNNTTEYDVTVKPKYQTKKDKPNNPPEDEEEEEDFVRRKALKVWQNDDENNRPEYIEVELLRDGRVYDTVKLNKKNNWRYTWSNLSDKYDWLVVEKDVPDDYDVVFERKGITFVITNTYDDPEPPKEDEIEDDETPRGTPEDETPEDEVVIEDEIPLSNLPQTGVLWWPIPILFVSGLIMLAIGFKKRAK